MWEPGSCPKDGSTMEPIPNMSDAWKCTACGLEVWAGELPTAEDYEQPADRMTLRSASYKPHISRSFVALPPGARSSGGGGRRKKKKKRNPNDLANRYRLDTK